MFLLNVLMKAQRPFFLIYLLYGMPVLDKKLWCIQQRGCFFSRNFSTRVSCNLSCIHASFYRSHKAHGWYDGLSCNDAATSGPFDYCHYATKYFYYVAMKSQKIHPCLQFFWWRRCRWSKVRSKLRNKADRSQNGFFYPHLNEEAGWWVRNTNISFLSMKTFCYSLFSHRMV